MWQVCVDVSLLALLAYLSVGFSVMSMSLELDADRDVADARVRSERVPQPHTVCCFVLHVLAQGCSCTFCEQRKCCDPRWELARASGQGLDPHPLEGVAISHG